MVGRKESLVLPKTYSGGDSQRQWWGGADMIQRSWGSCNKWFIFVLYLFAKFSEENYKVDKVLERERGQGRECARGELSVGRCEWSRLRRPGWRAGRCRGCARSRRGSWQTGCPCRPAARSRTNSGSAPTSSSAPGRTRCRPPPSRTSTSGKRFTAEITHIFCIKKFLSALIIRNLHYNL